jgi:hypothetical protein
VIIGNWGYRCIGWFELLLGVPLALLSAPISFLGLPKSLFFLVLVPTGGWLAWHGAGLARARVVADESGLEIRERHTRRVRWDQVRSIDAPQPGEWTSRYDPTAAMATVLLVSGELIPLAAVATWLRPAFWRAGVPRRLARQVAILRALHARYGTSQ